MFHHSKLFLSFCFIYCYVLNAKGNLSFVEELKETTELSIENDTVNDEDNESKPPPDVTTEKFESTSTDEIFFTTEKQDQEISSTSSAIETTTQTEYYTTDEILENITEKTESIFNMTLEQNFISSKNISIDHSYYNSTLVTDPEIFKHYWIDLNNIENVTTHPTLSSSYRKAATVSLSFSFPFYGHRIKKVTLATGGFIYVGDFIHSYLSATQYVAPLMANFDTSFSNESSVKYFDSGESLTVSWNKVIVRNRSDEGEFTFQTTLHGNGDVVFAYQNVPMFFRSLNDEHPVKSGLSDAYYYDNILYKKTRKTQYEYHRITFRAEDIRNGTIIYLKALPTCLDKIDCETCLSRTNPASHQCFWCPTLNRCSRGVDRYRQTWMKHCYSTKLSNITECAYSEENNIHFSQQLL